MLLGAVPLCILAVLVPPYDSVDPHTYVSIGHSQAGYGTNPYSAVVSSIPGWKGDPLLRDDSYADVPFAYSFLFAREMAAVVRVAGPDKFDIILAIKLVNVAAHLLTVWCVWAGCARLGGSRAAGAYLVAWNPILLLHGISNCHNDVLSGLALAAGMVLAGSRLWWACPSVLAAGALIKYSTLPVVPLAALFLAWRHGWIRVAASTLPAIALTAWVAEPYLADGGAARASQNLANVTHHHMSIGSIVVSPLAALQKLGPAWSGVDVEVANALKLAGGGLVLGLVGWLARRRWRQREYAWSEFVRDVVLVQLVLVCVASAKFYSWYLLMFWPAVAWLPVGSRLQLSAVAVGFAQIGSLMFLGGMNIVAPLVMIVLPIVWARRATRPAESPLFSLPQPDAGGRRAA